VDGGQDITLDAKYEFEAEHAFLTGTQALVRAPLVQRRRDLARGLNTAGYITGYRGSPVGGYDSALWSAQKFLDAHHIKFQAGVNEDMAATACWGTQQVGMWQGANYDGVFAYWYGKGPGVDRSGDALKHGNLAGSSPNGGVLALAGDDHGAKSSTTAHQSEQALIAAMIPILYPASVQEYLDYAIYGIAMSRFSGAWSGFKCAGDIIESAASVSLNIDRINPLLPEFQFPEGGVHIRWPDAPLVQEQRLISVKLKAAQAFVLANGLDRVSHPAAKKRLGIVAAGKGWLNVCQAFEELNLSDAEREELGIAVYKVAMPWPLEPTRIKDWAQGFDEILVVEEKRNVMEDQLARVLYDLRESDRPRLFGKWDEQGRPLVPEYGELSGSIVARIIAGRFLDEAEETCLTAAAAKLEARTTSSNLPAAPPERSPWFCAGCPHNSSTKVPDGSRALAGIGCHTMAVYMDRRTEAYTHMGAEGGTWIGQSPFTSEEHVFQNIGDGTYFHSGLMAVRAACASGVNMTYKVLYNDAVALTGGQPMDGDLMPWHISQQLWSEGVRRIALVSDEPDKYPSGTQWAPGTEIHHRKELEALQLEFREEKGITAIIYDQTCAAEKRRRRKRGLFPDPAKRVFINEAVCEGCGDCSTVSNCVAVRPLETELGRKRAVDQSSCNKDFTCLEGFCPSFVTVEGGRVRKAEQPKVELDDPAAGLPEPERRPITGSYNMLLTGIGGTGVVTAGAILGTAADRDGIGVSVLDQTGLSQKNGAVMSHVRLSADRGTVLGTRTSTGLADLILGFDMVVAAGKEAVNTMSGERTRALINDHLVPIAAFAENPDMPISSGSYIDVIQAKLGPDRVEFLDATVLATKLMGDSITSNIFQMGYAFQKELIPLSLDSILAAIELNGVAVEANKRAFSWGRLAAAEPARISHLTGGTASVEQTDESLDDFIARRVADLLAYQNAAYAKKYAAAVEQVRAAEAIVSPGRRDLEEAVARSLYKLMAYKDEYEVARLYTDPAYRGKLAMQFDGDYKLRFHFAPPILSPKDPVTGHPRKIDYGGWMESALKILARFKFLRGSILDPFGRLADRKLERSLIGEYGSMMDGVVKDLTLETYEAALQLAALPMTIRGFGHIKQQAVESYQQDRQRLLQQLQSAAHVRADAAE
jgi:indolepyruvate ferredoxin oxidoreductase